MHATRQLGPATLSLALVLCAVSHAFAQNVTVDLNDAKQVIRGYGGMNHPVWISDLTETQRTTAFGNDQDQMGLSILRIHVDENQNSWSRDVATAQRAIELGAIVFASPWNPPSDLATNIDGQKRVNPSLYGEYAAHLTDFYNFMKDNGVDLYAVSIQNEPDYANEWTWWTADNILNFMRDNAGSLPFRVMAPESFQYRKQMSDPILNDDAALANLDILGAHTYGTQIRDFPYPLFKEKGAGKELWMTEVYYPNSEANSADRWPEALDVAYHIHSAMVEAEFQAYVWWYIRREYGLMKDDGQISKRGYSMVHFSKFVRPGFVRVEATKSPANNVFVSAYKGESDVVIVLVNKNSSSQTIQIELSGGDVASFDQFTTSANKNLSDEGAVQASNGSLSVTLESQSVTTLHGSGDVPGSGGAQGEGGAPGEGGAQGEGGSPGSGGISGPGGAQGLGGRPGQGGTPGVGGRPDVGGAPGQGGMVSFGGRPGLGGAISSGGHPPEIGGTTSGGTSGGAQATGGGSAPSSGGNVAGAGQAGLYGAGTNTVASDETSSDDGGCGCRVNGEKTQSGALALSSVLGLLTLAGLRRRRKTAA